MNLLKATFKRIILIVVLISILITFMATPMSYAKLELEEGEFYYTGSTKGSYVPSTNIFAWLVNALGQIADFILGMLSMIIRAPFVGWTALLEKMLTWALESTMGVSADGAMVANTSNLSGLTNSSNNVTVEAIVYNRVAALDIDIFDVKFDRTISGTGQKLVCRHCIKQDVEAGTGVSPYIPRAVNECITDDKIPQIKEDAAKLGKRQKLNVEKYCADDCDCGGCDACEFYVAQLLQDEPLIYKLKLLVATWYTIIRFLAVAAMLLVLLGVGIKMAISTIASDKAVYQRMLVDWVVGFIILFTIHYFMIFVIQINEILVKTIADTASQTTKYQMVELGEAEAEYTDSDLELKIYEEVRTRAYDAKVSNGMIGMVMYMSLVFLAFKYVVIYLKRFLTIVVLTLMAPAVGVAYALQKVLSGRSMALKTWMTEYIMNVIIQTVHALIYSIFVSQALIMSLQSFAGMILAIILINYTSKADELFKKIFKFGGGDSLLGHTEGAADSFKQNMQAAIGFAAGAKPAAKILMNTPYGKIVTGAGKAAVAGAITAAGGIYKSLSKDDSYYREKEIDAEMDYSQGGNYKLKFEDGYEETDDDYNKRRQEAAKIVDKRNERKQEEEVHEEKIEESTEKQNGLELKTKAELTTAKLKAEGENPQEETKAEAKEAKKAHNEFKSAQIPATKSIMRAHWERLISRDDIFEEGKPKSAFKAAWTIAVGSSHYDRKKGRWVNDKNSMFDQLSASKLLGLTEQDRNMLKDIGGDMIGGLMGVGCLFAGIGTFAINPKAGMVLLSKGIGGTSKVFSRDTDISTAPARYKFNRFSSESIDKMRRITLEKAKAEGNEAFVADLNRRHPQLVEKMKRGLVSGVTATSLAAGGLAFTSAPLLLAASTVPLTAATVGGAVRLTRNSALSGKVYKLTKHHAKQQKKLIEKFNNEADQEELNSIKASTEYRDKCFEKAIEQQALAEIGYRTESNGENVEAKVTIKAPTIDEKDLKSPERFVGKGSETSPQIVAKTLDEELDKIITTLTAKGTIDITSKSVQDTVLKQLGIRLKDKKIIAEIDELNDLLIGGKEELTRKIKFKTLVRNRTVEEADKKLKETLTVEEATEVQDIIKSITSTSTQQKRKTVSEITVDDIKSRMKTKTKDGSQAVDKKDGSQSVKRDGDVQLDSTKMQAIQEYLNSIQEPIGGKTAEYSGSEASTIVSDTKLYAARKKQSTKRKLREVLEVAFHEESVVSEQGTISKENVDLLLKAEDIDPRLASVYATDTLKNLLKIKELNQRVLRREPEIPKGSSKAYAETVRDNSVEIIRIAEDKKKLISLEMEKDLGTSRKPVEEITADIEKLKTRIVAREERIQVNNSRLQYKGPVQDIDSYIKGTIFKEKNA